MSEYSIITSIPGAMDQNQEHVNCAFKVNSTQIDSSYKKYPGNQYRRIFVMELPIIYYMSSTQYCGNETLESTPAPDTSAPETPAPETPAPETPAPETPAPETPVPETPAPDTSAPETPAPDTPANYYRVDIAARNILILLFVVFYIMTY